MNMEKNMCGKKRKKIEKLQDKTDHKEGCDRVGKLCF